MGHGGGSPFSNTQTRPGGAQGCFLLPRGTGVGGGGGGSSLPDPTNQIIILYTTYTTNSLVLANVKRVMNCNKKCSK